MGPVVHKAIKKGTLKNLLSQVSVSGPSGLSCFMLLPVRLSYFHVVFVILSYFYVVFVILSYFYVAICQIVIYFYVAICQIEEKWVDRNVERQVGENRAEYKQRVLRCKVHFSTASIVAAVHCENAITLVHQR